MDSLKVLDPEGPIREADIIADRRHVSKVPIAEIADAIRSEKICSSTNRGLDFACWIIPLYLGLLMQNGV